MKKDREDLRGFPDPSPVGKGKKMIEYEFYPRCLLRVLFQLFISPFKPLFDQEA
jgi:hypothetical protein